MPLPDERPRQSVANLIGRFEQQTKRNSIGPGTPIQLPNFQQQRTVSVTSQATGDAAKADEKEKREWPPRNANTNATVEGTPSKAIPSDVGKSSSSVSTTATTTPVRKATEGVPAPASLSLTPATPVSAPTSSELPSPIVTNALPPQTEPAPSSPPSAISPSSSSAATARTKPISAVVKPKSDATSTKTPSRTTARTSTPAGGATHKPGAPTSPSKVSSHPPVTKPLKAQLTGQSTTSTTSTVRARSRASNATATSTPIRAKTPTVTPSRPKTPSGLLAPTAASLAKAKNTPPVPTPVRKTTSSANANAIIDRLSKPTAASASKVRSPPVTPSKTQVRQAPAKTARGSMLKPRIGHAPARIKQEKEKETKAQEEDEVKKANGAANVLEVIDAIISVAGFEEEHVNDARIVSASPSHFDFDEEPEHEKDEVVESYDDDFADETIIHDEPIIHEESTKEEPVHEEPVLSNTLEVEHASEEPLKEKDIVVPTAEENGHVELAVEEHDHDEPSSEAAEHIEVDSVHPEETTITVEDEPKVSHGNEIEGMVNMLEATNLRPPSVISLSIDDAGSIPDEDL